MPPRKKKGYRRKKEENKKRSALKRALETPEEREKRLQTDRLKHAVTRALETDEQRQKRLLVARSRLQYKRAQKRKQAFLEYFKEIKIKEAIKAVRQALETGKKQQQKRSLEACMMQQYKREQQQENWIIRKLDFWDYCKMTKTKQEELRAECEVQQEREEKNAVLNTLASLTDQVVKQAEEKKKSLYEDFWIYKTRQDCTQSPRLFLQRLNGFSPNYYVSQCMSDSTRFKVLRRAAIKRSMLTPEEKEEISKRARLRAAEAKAAWTEEQRAFYRENRRSYYNRVHRKKQNQEYYEKSRRLAITLAELRNELVMQKKINKTRQVSKLSPQLSLQSKNGFSSNSISQADFGDSPYMQYWYPENCINILTDDEIVKYPELFNAFSNHHCISTASETTTSINVSTPNIKKEIVPSVELGNSRSASKPATNTSTIKIKEEPTSDLHCSASNSSPGSENSIPNSVFNNIKEESTSELYNSSTYPLTNSVENYYSEVYSEPVSDQNMNNNNNIQNLYIVDGNVMCISSISVQEPTEMITPD